MSELEDLDTARSRASSTSIPSWVSGDSLTSRSSSECAKYSFPPSKTSPESLSWEFGPPTVNTASDPGTDRVLSYFGFSKLERHSSLSSKPQHESFFEGEELDFLDTALEETSWRSFVSDEDAYDNKRRRDDEGVSKEGDGYEGTARWSLPKRFNSAPIIKRRTQNRIVQQAFQNRKEKHLKELELDLENLELEKTREPTNEENRLLRAQLDRLQSELKDAYENPENNRAHDDPHTCTECSERKLFSSQGALHAHIVSYHCKNQDITLTKGTLPRTQKPDDLRCLWHGCSYQCSLDNSTDLLRHASAVHVSPNAQNCQVDGCSKAFLTKDKLSEHMRGHKYLDKQLSDVTHLEPQLQTKSFESSTHPKLIPLSTTQSAVWSSSTAVKNDGTKIQGKEDNLMNSVPQGSPVTRSLPRDMENAAPRFEVLSTDHPLLAAWNEISPQLLTSYKDIMGCKNPGVLELLMEAGQPTVIVTCRWPAKVRRSRIRDMLDSKNMDCPIVIGRGGVSRSVEDLNDDIFNLEDLDCATDDVDSYEYVAEDSSLISAFLSGPAVYGRYLNQPDCGASIGSYESAFGHGRVSLGGYVELLGPTGWDYFATTSHHLIERAPEFSPGDDDDSFLPSSNGVRDGIWMTDTFEENNVQICSPAEMDYNAEVSRMKQRLALRRFLPAKLEYPDLEERLSNLQASSIQFGRAMHSSGLSINSELQLQMDWLLIGDIPRERFGWNTVGRASQDFREGKTFATKEETELITEYTTKDEFEALLKCCGMVPDTYIGGLSRVHGRGCESGLRDGHLSRSRAVMSVDGMEPTLEWSFAPRGGNGLGIAGDSGTWILTETGVLLGQVLGFNSFTKMTYYTPMWALFENIREISGAIDIRLPLSKHREPSGSSVGPELADSGYGGSSPLRRLQVLPASERPES